MIRFDPIFPNGANVNFVKVMSRGEISIRTYERGVENETLSCGTGSVASAYLAHRLDRVDSGVLVNTKGGTLNIYLDDFIFMEGPADTVYRGVIVK